MAAEGEGSLAERLGPPDAYAAELRLAAGLGAATTPARGLDDRIAVAVRRVRGALGVADRKAGPVLGYGKASEFLRLLLPAWWVLRGYLVAMAITVLTTSQFGLLPRLGGSTLAAVLMLTVCVLASIWLGRREARLRPVVRVGLGLAGVGLVLFGLVGFDKADQYGTVYIDQTYSTNQYEYVQDVYAYDENGNPLSNVRLFDQDGNPIQLGDPYRCLNVDDYQAKVDATGPTYPHCPNRLPYLIAPQPGLRVPDRGAVVTPTPDGPTEAPPTASPVPEPSATAAPTGTPGATPTN
ncbi:hypothetical protein Asi02nite_50140 [Asanoa siamensis]|uniref:Uncharacterized protein n=1 Tax=Asanoa siamensis TaxID=926357 RepID=A0ABQ4CW29_9ACTN|nr:hypothetical protein Asi02nite_50140 [Asanoa siamensis]